ncbi:TetR/AcrR family transcriptional regulator [Allgaiera indica]|uniref:Transcriptional regulator, TetR family n=1 Tax=Allgaiera indica TaxID=765699 RepID=A0A1H2VXD2_9RHOB|nr:TetR/AcrR family transcriptional regulator [Allgaiera indica]SDW72973.1 transcriptional regulator, TetR family [Allgaiera indica]
MKPKPDRQPDHRPGRAPKARSGRAGAVRLPFNERRAQILEVAAEFFAEHGLTAQTRQLADRCGISQRLLYRFFPTKEDLLREVYRNEILGAFNATWFVSLQDRSRPVAERLERFYADYLASTLTRKWLRLFLHVSLDETNLAPDYIAAIVTPLLEVIMRETAAEKGLSLPDSPDALRQMGWTLHGAISHYAMRLHLCQGSGCLPESRMIALNVRLFLSGFEDMLAAAQQD